MDSKTLIVTVVAAIIGAFVKEITSCLLSLGKSSLMTAKLIAKAKEQLTINKITVVLNFLTILFFIWNLYIILSDSEPLTKKSAFTIGLNLALIAVSWIRIEVVMNNSAQLSKINFEIQRKFNEHLQWINEQDRKLLESIKRTKTENERNT